MQVANLNEYFDVAQYQLAEKAAILRLVDGEIAVISRYIFRNASGIQQGTQINVQMIVTPEQSDDLKAILAQILQATNAEIEAETGWAKYTEPEEET